MKCPFCGHLEDRVIDSRGGGAGDVIRRRRECEGCARRFTTYERVDEILPTVIKKDGRREPYDRQKLVRGIRVACIKRPVTVDQIDALADAVEQDLQESESREVDAGLLGERVLARMRDIDDVAYVRFASVYRSFRNIDEFVSELGRLQNDKRPLSSPVKVEDASPPEQEAVPSADPRSADAIAPPTMTDPRLS